MIAAYKASPGRHALAFCAVVAAGWAAWLCAGNLAGSLALQRSVISLTGLKWMLFVTLALMLVALFCIVSKAQRHSRSTAVQLRKAIRANQLQVHYQPIVNSTTGHLVGAEALSRWNRQGNAISPRVLVAAAEKSGLIGELTRSVIRQVAEDYCTYFWACKDFSITVKLCAQDILDPAFADFVADVMATYNLPASVIIFEVAECAPLDQNSAATQLHRLRACGHRIAIDDFGTGSCRSLIESLPAKALARRHFQCPPDVNPYVD
jgi:sensor c-di-GMP phosphodiesterase-like protein